MKKNTALFAAGAAGYSCLEVLARGYTHWTMALLGGLCLVALGCIAREFAGSPLAAQAALGAGVITAAEFCTGLLVNLVLGWQVWDYSAEAGNFLGQVCPRFSFYWFLLCYAALGLARAGRNLYARRTGAPQTNRTGQKAP